MPLFIRLRAFARLHPLSRAWPNAGRRRLVLAIGIVGAGAAGLLPKVARSFDARRMLAAAERLGPQAHEGAQALALVLERAPRLAEGEQLRAVNDFFNQRILFVEDLELWGTVDHWATPLETLGRNAGDCEDFAIAKYFSLLAIGLPARRLRLVYVRARLEGAGGPVLPHMVLAHYTNPQADPMILDNLIPELRPASARPDLTPVFSFNSEGLWEGAGSRSAGNPVQRLSRWRSVLARAAEEGFL